VSSVALLEAAERGLAEEGYATRDDHGRLHRSQWLMIRRDALDGVHRFGSLLGLNPTARTRLPVSPPRTELDELADRLLSH
jgi:phage terminase small subunit